MDALTTADAPRYGTSSEAPTPVAALWIALSPDAQLRGTPLQMGVGAAERVGREPGLRLHVGDRWMSREHFEVTALPPDRAGRPRWRLRDLGTRNGTRVNGERVLGERDVACGDVIRAGATLFVADEGVSEPGDLLGLLGLSAPLARIRHTVRLFARATVRKPVSGADRTSQHLDVPLPIHVTGPSGAGKEQVARAIHEASGRPGPLVPRNVATITPRLMESELFGYEKGAFTGADKDRRGLLDAAHQGTLFLDEIGELPPELQAKLLSAVDLGEVSPVGSARPRYVDVRVVTATLRSLSGLVASGDFRDDLYHRLAGVVIDVPPLAARRLDVAPLAARFLRGAGGDVEALVARHAAGPYWLADLMEPALAAAWPGNVRQLQGWAARTMALLEARWPDAGAVLPDPGAVWQESGGREAAVAAPPAAEAPATRPGPGGPADAEHAALVALFDDPDALARAISARAEGNIQSFARLCAAPLGLKPASARRRIYDVLGPERVQRLRG